MITEDSAGWGKGAFVCLPEGVLHFLKNRSKIFLFFKLPCAFLVCPMYMTFSLADPEINPRGREATALIGSGCMKSVLERKWRGTSDLQNWALCIQHVREPGIRGKEPLSNFPVPCSHIPGNGQALRAPSTAAWQKFKNVQQFKAVKREMEDEESGEMVRHVVGPIYPSRNNRLVFKRLAEVQ